MPDAPDTSAALVLFSGGQDSTVCLANALARFGRVETVGFDYGQRHAVELTQRGVVLRALRARFAAWGARLGDDHVIDARVIGAVGDSALTREVAIQIRADGLPNTFVPARNLLFLTLAAALACRRGLQTLVTGVSQADSSGYPDCRDDTMRAMQQALTLGIGQPFVIDTPLMHIDKAAAWQLAHDLGQRADPGGGGDALVQLIVEHTHTCYTGDRSQRHDWGYGCGDCPACRLRADGWRRWRGQNSAASR
jgi:7-cyano-7-deazaguanine synthase